MKTCALCPQRIDDKDVVAIAIVPPNFDTITAVVCTDCAKAHFPIERLKQSQVQDVPNEYRAQAGIAEGTGTP